MYDLRGCRACLKQNCKLEQINDTTKSIYCAVSGLDFAPGDCYPKYFCAECSTEIRKIVAFKRRCRRAFLAMKQIVAVRKKITLADLSIIDRKKNNLTSNIDYWRNINTGFYSINKNEETDTKYSDTSGFLREFQRSIQGDIKPYVRVVTTKYKPQVINNTYIAVDIKPNIGQDTDNEVFYEKVEYLSDDLTDANDDTETNEAAIEKAVYVSDNDVDDDVERNETADDNVTDVDLEDVFKGLPEEKANEDSDHGVSELPESGPKKREGRRYRMTVQKAFTLSRTLVDFDIELLLFDEQVATFRARKEAEPYRSAGFKCAMCLIVYPDMAELMKHIRSHTRKQKRLTQEQRKSFSCSICKDSFACRAELTAHSATYHWYKYSCKKCKVDKYTLFDTLKCHYNPPVSMSKYYTMAELFQMSDMTSLEPLRPMENNCRHCGRWAPTNKAVKFHERRHIVKPKGPRKRSEFQCDMCGLWCGVREHMEGHMQSHYRFFTCKQCDKVFEGWHAAHDHLMEHELPRCSYCDVSFRSDSERLEHEAMHSAESELDCNLCGLPVKGPSQMYLHQLAKHGYISLNSMSVGDPAHRCGMCGVQFASAASLKTHKLKQGHVEADQIGGKCGSCKKIFFTVGEFIAHRRNNNICRKYPVKCAYCDVILTHFYQSRRHYEQEHPNQPSEHQHSSLYTICEQCGISIKHENMGRHRKRHTMKYENQKASLTCKICKQKMYSSRTYVSHILFNHTPKPYICGLCPYRSKMRSECRDHILKVHAPELPYACQKCSQQFSHLDALERHSIRVHGGSADRSFYKPLKDTMATVSVFPHMKIDGSLIPPVVIDDAGLFLYDYLCKSSQQVDWRDYFVFDTGVEPTETDPSFHKKQIQKRIYGRKRKKYPANPINKTLLQAVESQPLDVKEKSEVNEERGKKRLGDSNVGRSKVKMAKLDDTTDWVNADVDNVEHEEVLGYDMPDLSYGFRKKPQKKRDRRKGSKPVFEVVKEAESESFNDVEMKEAKEEMLDVDNEEIVQGYDMPLQAASVFTHGDPSKAEIIVEETSELETVEEEGEVLDMNQLLNENYQIIEDNGEQYVVVNGNLYRLQIG